MLQRLLTRLLAAASMAAALAFAPAYAQNAQGYVELDPAQPGDTPGKIEVLEFFSYGCGHCNALEPLLQSWAKTLPEDVVVQQVPVGFNAGMKPMQQLYYTLAALGRLDLHEKVFRAIHEERKRLFTKDAIVDWAVDQGLDRAQFTSTFDSFGVQSKVTRANQLMLAYRVEGTPTLAVAGRYVTSPTLARGYQETIDQADRLVKMVRDGGK
jgi:Protein-disulfide isomerase